jgi:transcriptional regulator with XRE-family HTH domain
MQLCRRVVRSLVETPIGTLTVYDTGGAVRVVHYGPFFGQWCRHVLYYSQRRGLSQLALAKKVEIPPSTMNAYMTGKARPPLRDLHKWHRALRLTGEEAKALEIAAYEHYTLPEVWDRWHAALRHIADLEVQLSQLRQHMLDRPAREAGDAKG